MAAVKRRHFLTIGGGVLGLGVAGRLAFPRLARPAAPDGPLSRGAAELIDRAWKGLDPARTLDCHLHIVGAGTGGTGCFINPRQLRFARHPLQYARFSIYRIAAGIDDMARADQAYVERIIGLCRSQLPRGRHLALAFDQVHREDGTPAPAESEFYTPNDYVLKLARDYPDCFVPAASIHPYRKDAVAELERVAGLGAAAVKWLPNAHLIDPSSPACDSFYAKLAELGVPLLTHAGEEKAVESEEAQRFGNPLLLRRALDAGVKVIVCHAASSGESEDLDAPGRPPVENFRLFLRLAEDGKYTDRLFADVSALMQFNRCEHLPELLRREGLHARLLDGSDYPLPAINALIRTGKLAGLGLITDAERELVNEIDRHDPLLFDFVLKRTVRIADGGVERRLPDSAFMPPPGIFRGL